VDLYEMRPVRQTPVHQTGDFAELVCSNSLRGNALDQAAGLLKEEMRRLDSLVVRTADAVKVPAGSALAVDRGLFARRMTEAIAALPEVRLHRSEVLGIPDDPVTIVATGPLTSQALAAEVAAFVGQAHLHFFDAVSPVVEADSIDFDKAFRASRYGKGGDDYLNCPMSEAEYRAFHQAVTSAECAPLRVITAFVVTVVPWNSVVTSDGSMPSARTPSTTPRSKRGGVDGTFATRDSPVSLTAKTSVNVPPVSQPTIQLTGAPSSELHSCRAEHRARPEARTIGQVAIGQVI